MSFHFFIREVLLLIILFNLIQDIIFPLVPIAWPFLGIHDWRLLFNFVQIEKLNWSLFFSLEVSCNRGLSTVSWQNFIYASSTGLSNPCQACFTAFSACVLDWFPTSNVIHLQVYWLNLLAILSYQILQLRLRLPLHFLWRFRYPVYFPSLFKIKGLNNFINVS